MTKQPSQYDGRKGTRTILTIIIALAMVTFPIAGAITTQSTPWVPTDRITHVPTEPGTASAFGASIDVDGELAAIGDPDQDSVHIYQRQAAAWIHQVTLEGSGGFGHAVALEDDTLLVGAPWEGTVSIYTRTTQGWEPSTTLTGSSTFGFSIDIHEGTALVGEPSASQATLLEATNGDWETSTTFEGEGLFATQVAIHDERLAIGHLGAGTHVYDNGATGWEKTSILAAPWGTGQNVDLNQGTLAIGAPTMDRVHVYEHDGTGWEEATLLEPSDASPVDGRSNFGHALALGEDDTLLVGAPQGDSTPGILDIPPQEEQPCASESGARACIPTTPGDAYVFEPDGEAWTQTAKLVGEHGEDHRFGSALALDLAGGAALVGAPGSLYEGPDPTPPVDAEDTVTGFTQIGQGGDSL